jgi:hypothetical protein
MARKAEVEHKMNEYYLKIQSENTTILGTPKKNVEQNEQKLLQLMLQMRG